MPNIVQEAARTVVSDLAPFETAVDVADRRAPAASSPRWRRHDREAQVGPCPPIPR